MSRKHTEQALRVEVEPCGYDEAMTCVVERHRRRGRLIRCQVRICLRATLDGETVGYAVIGEPCARQLNPQGEVRRVVSWAWGAASALYREAERRGATLTYTDGDETGHSLRAAGWYAEHSGKTRGGRGGGERTRWRCARWKWLDTMVFYFLNI